ncbi:MAG: biopolymer transporter ExbD [Candidatus Azobacteroides sp.]|nr:biopolymer transporter ExbD [Candidatus Azobacteroides sp.]
MAEVQVKEQEGGKNKQKKKHLRVDFTPMVDMNMLLITFFMFCTTLLKPQTMNINMPSKEKVDPKTQNKVRESTAVTLLLGANDELYYYLGMIDSTQTYKDPNFLVASDYTPNGLRTLLLDKNKGTYEDIQALKERLKKLQITEVQFNDMAKAIQDKAMKDLKIAPTVMIKPTEQSTYKNLVDALDEMLVCNIGAYAIVDLEPGDRYLLYQKTQNADYLTDQQRAQAQASAQAPARK